MKVLTFEEWCEANQDLVDDVMMELDPSRFTLGFLESLGAESGEFLRHRLQGMYDEQHKRDADNLAKWNAAVAE